MKMLPRERVLCALNFQQPDCVPIFDFIYSRKLYKHVIGRIPEYYNAEDVMDCASRIGYDLAIIPFGGFGGIRNYNTSDDKYLDEWGTTYQKESGVSWPADAPVGFPIKDRSDWKNYIVPDPSIHSRLNEINTAVKMSKDTNIAVIGSVRGPFSAAWLLLGMENFSMLLYDDPDFVDEVLEKCTDFFIEGGRRMIEAGADGILFADDYGSVTSPLISPGHFEKHVLPQVRRMVNTFKSMGVPVIMHSDGNIKMLMDLILTTGINGCHPIERQANMDLKHMKETYGRRLCLIGNVNNKSTLVKGSVEDVKAETIECIKIAAPGGGYILASDHSLHDDIPIENVFALYETGRKYGVYPISV